MMNNYEMEDRSSNATGLITQMQNPYESTPTKNNNPYEPDSFLPTNYTVPVEQDIRASFGADRNKLQVVQP